MTQDEIIRMAREAGFTDIEASALEYFYQAAFAVGAAREREACAKLCIEQAERHEEMSQYEDTADYAERCLVYGKHIRTCAAAIRNRGNHG